MYKDYYQLCVYSFADGNGDGYGDFRGIEQNLNYIKELGFEGIWLSPIHPSSTYHGYTVDNYYEVNDKFGTMADFESLVSTAKEMGITIMLDMVINHSGNNNPLFTAFKSAVLSGDTNSNAYNMYAKSANPNSGYTELGRDNKGQMWYYESNFGSNMPEFDLKSTEAKTEISNIMKFWMDKGVEAFRLDAVLYYEYGSNEGSVQFCEWLMKECQKTNPNIYMVGEAWTSCNGLRPFYLSEDSLSSYMNFDMSNAAGTNANTIMSNVYSMNANRYGANILASQKAVGDKIDAIFAANHDSGRLANTSLAYYSATKGMIDGGVDNYKFGLALLYTASGNIFNYYGTEIGQRAGVDSNGHDGNDPAKRAAFNWGNEYIISVEKGDTANAGPVAYMTMSTPGNNDYYRRMFGYYDLLDGDNVGDSDLGGVAEQKTDEFSIYSYFERLMILRRQFPEISRVEAKVLAKDISVNTDYSKVCVMTKTYGDNTVLVIYNLDRDVAVDVNLADFGLLNYNTVLASLTLDNSDSDIAKGVVTALPQSVTVVGIVE